DGRHRVKAPKAPPGAATLPRRRLRSNSISGCRLPGQLVGTLHTSLEVRDGRVSLQRTKRTSRRKVLAQETGPVETAPPEHHPDGLAVELVVINDDWKRILRCGQRTIDRMRASGKLPKPDFHIGRMPRWWRSTVVAWIEAQSSNGNGGGR